MDASKTTFYLSNALRMRLKAVAAERGKSIKDLLAEGAELVLARYPKVADRSELQRRATKAREQLRQGLYEGPSIKDGVDALLYAAEQHPTLGGEGESKR